MVLRQLGAVLLSLLVACATSTPPASQRQDAHNPLQSRWYEVDIVEPGSAPTQPVEMSRHAFRRTLRRLALDMHVDVPPPRYAREMMEARPELEGQWVVEMYQGRVYSLVPLESASPLEEAQAAAVREDYLAWCARVHARKAADCLALQAEGGPHLLTDDRRTLALALAFSRTLEETRQALEKELVDTDKVLASLMWMTGTYLALWLSPEPTVTKGAAATLTVLLVGWVGLEGLYALVDGYFMLANAAHHARTFAELREAGERFAQVLGDKLARLVIVAAAALAQHTAGQVAQRVQSLPGYPQAAAQAGAQGVQVPLAVAVETVEQVVVTPQGGLALVMALKGDARVPAKSGGPGVQEEMRHRGGNRQVLLDNRQRWHLTRGQSLKDIPREDPVGDQIQEVTTRVAERWGPEHISDEARDAIKRMLAAGKPYRARLLEAQARGRWVEKQVLTHFRHLHHQHVGVDLIDPATGLKYEILSGTHSNLGLHGRRMHDVFFRMITF